MQTSISLRSSRIEDAPAVRSLEAIEDRALELEASDIHLEPLPDGGRVRVRVDGILRELEALPMPLYLLIVSRVKLLAGMDIADKRQPQDGRYTIARNGRDVDARVSSMPTLQGEKLVIRLLNPRRSGPRLDALGMSAGVLESYRRLIAAPYGFVIASGPTGSGKTTTLYSSLAEIGSDTRNICTVEDPVEIRIDGVAQVNVNVRAGLGFATALRSFLRQDPNVIMVGEMRDAETTAVAISAALSGQLVLTSLHSNDAPRTIERLAELGASRHAIAAALSGVISQRLVRKLCRACRRPREADGYCTVGCRACGGVGYSGRIGIFELLVVDDRLRDAIAAGASTLAIADLGRAGGYEPLVADGLAKTRAGETTLEELRRVVACAP